jgi:polar amino acid transport system substrate-binding protein
VVAGAVEYGYAQAIGVPNNRIAILPDTPSAVAAVIAGRVDAYAGTSLTVQRLLDTARDPALARADPFRDPVIDGARVIGYGAFGFRKEDTALADEFNRHLRPLIGSARHLELVRRFGLTEAELPGRVTAEELCRGQEG